MAHSAREFSPSADAATPKSAAPRGESFFERRVSPAFPIEKDEQFVVRDGKGRTVETWRVRRVDSFKSFSAVHFAVAGYREVGGL